MEQPAPLTLDRPRLDTPALSPGRPLTAREREVLALFAEGLGTDAAARRLAISRVTVRNHSQRILAKLGVHSRLAAVARGRETGLLGNGNGNGADAGPLTPG
jgi:DNA-binding NarL/FixJ family response regulator